MSRFSRSPHPFHFLREVLRSSGSVGAIWPSSPFLAKKIVGLSGVDQAHTILELGPGDGIFTRYILKAKSSDARFLALEKNPAFAKDLQHRFPSTKIVEGCATELTTLLKNHGMHSVETIVSGLPWAIFPKDLQDTILEQVYTVLSPGGTFATFAYFGPHWLGGGRVFRRSLKNRFPSLATSPVEVLNFPPAFVYVGKKMQNPS